MIRLAYLTPDIGDIQRLTLQVRRTSERMERNEKLIAQYAASVRLRRREQSQDKGGINMDSSRRKNSDRNSLRINDRDVDDIRNADLAIRTGIVPRLMRKKSNHEWLHWILHKGGRVRFQQALQAEIMPALAWRLGSREDPSNLSRLERKRKLMRAYNSLIHINVPPCTIL
jgi:hypothetical protein